MDYTTRQITGFLIAQLNELQGSESFTLLLSCSESELREDSLRLYMHIDALKSKLQSL